MSKFSRTFTGLGTENVLTLYEPRVDYLLEKSENLVEKYESILTINRMNSEVISVNSHAGKHPVVVSRIAFEIIKKAVLISRANLGFNVAIGPVVKQWGVGFTGANLPSKTKIKELMEITNPRDIILDQENSSVFLKHEGMKIDLGGIGKGYIADALKDFWIRNGVKKGVINLGGNILLVGQGSRDFNRWKIGIQSPLGIRDASMGTVESEGCSVVTSGIYERFFNKNGRRYHHIFDPKTGYPVDNDVLAVTVITKTSVDGEIWSSLAFYNGPEKTKKLIGNNDHVKYIFIMKNRDVIISDDLYGNFKIVDPNYSLNPRK